MDGQTLSSVTVQSEAVFELRHISKQFPGVKALDDVSLTFRDREIHGLVGENGAGKSTLMSVMMGLQQPDGGTLLRHGKPVTFASSTEALSSGLGMVPQELNLVPQMTVMENVMLGFAPSRAGGLAVDWSAVRRKAREVLDEIGAGTIATDAVASSLSAAQQQLVQMARALALGAKILIFDEPTASLSLREADHLLSLIRQLRDDGCCIIYISHRLEEVLSLCDTITVLRNGCKVVDLDANGTTEADLVRNMIGREFSAPDKTRNVGHAAANTEPLLSVEDLSCNGYFRNVSLSVHPGEIVGVAGLVGAGRTELARCIFGDLRPTAGKISAHGRELHIRHPSDAIHAGIAYVPEERKRLGIFPVLGVSENMTLPILSTLTTAGHINRSKQKACVDDYIQKLDIKTSDPDKPIRDLSGGNQQKVILARWLLMGCRVLILDEPTRGIDVNAKFEIHALLRTLVADGMAILLISSELEEVIQLADRILVMNAGTIKGEIPAWDATQEKILSMAVG